MIKHVEFSKPKLLRRICSALIDFLIVVIIAVLFSLIVTPIIEKSDAYKQNYSIYCHHAVESGLYQYYDDSKTDVITANIEDEKVLIDFYTNNVDNGLSVYNEQKKNYTDVFNYDITKNEFSIKEGTSEETLKAYYLAMRDYTITNYFNNYMRSIEEAKKASNILGLLNMAEFLIVSFIGLSIVYLILPLILKNGSSVGKLMFKLKVISSKGSLDVSKLQILFRGLVTIFFEFIVSIYCVMMFYIPLPLVISLIIMLVNKKQLSFHDLTCSTIVVDVSTDVKINESQKIILTVKEDD